MNLYLHAASISLAAVPVCDSADLSQMVVGRSVSVAHQDDGIVAARDFRAEALSIVQSREPHLVNDRDVVRQVAALLELSFRKQRLMGSHFVTTSPSKRHRLHHDGV